jgi:predicted O-linked N-acetylglucosamine transferase (SPINDLY family)
MSESDFQQHIKQGLRLHRQGDLLGAKTVYARVLASEPDHPDALHLYGLACLQLGDRETAVGYIERAVQMVPNEPVVRNNLGNALYQLGRINQALKQLHAALALRPDYAGAHQNIANVYARAGDREAALKHARQSVQLDPSRAEAWHDLGLILLDHVLLTEAAEAFRRALATRPEYPAAATSLLYVLNLLPDADPAEIAAEHRRIATGAFQPMRSIPLQHRRSGRYRIGYVSGDLRAHAVNFFFEPVLEHHDREQFEVYCYSNVDKPDDTTTRMMRLADHWRDISQWSDDRVLTQITTDAIDILVDLSGHTKHHRLGVFACKPAPVQITWLGFPNTSGLDQMDFQIVDQHTAPADESALGSEDFLRLGTGFACFRPPADAPPVGPAPFLENGFITLGSLHKLEKVNEAVIARWARILNENEDTRLLMARDQLDDWHQRRIQAAFSRHGVAADRLRMTRLSPGQDSFFSVFAEMDIMLDTFPWSGHTLACCALWMGVPVVSLHGDRHAGRMVASVLRLMGLDELVAGDPDDYGHVVHELCRHMARIVRYRVELRNRFEESVLRDEAGFTAGLERQYQRLLNP